MKMKLPLLIVPLFFLGACSSSEDASNMQSTQEPLATNSMATEVDEQTSNESKLTPIPMSDSNENGRYFLTSHTTGDGIENVEYIRRGNESDAYGKMQIKCLSNEMRKNSTDNINSLEVMDLGDWYTPTPDWTDKDIFNFICNN